MSLIWGDSVLNQWNPEITATVGAMSPEEIFKYYAKSIGIGGIAMAGIIGIIKSWGHHQECRRAGCQGNGPARLMRKPT